MNLASLEKQGWIYKYTYCGDYFYEREYLIEDEKVKVKIKIERGRSDISEEGFTETICIEKAISIPKFDIEFVYASMSHILSTENEILKYLEISQDKLDDTVKLFKNRLGKSEE